MTQPRVIRLKNLKFKSVPENDKASWRRHQHFSRKTKGLVVVAIVVVLLVSLFAFLPSPTESPLAKLLGFSNGQAGSGLIEPNQAVNSSVWRQVAANAWAYFQPGVGVDPETGLPYASGMNFKAFTNWDLGVYIQAVIDAQKIGLVAADGAWGSNSRLDKVLTFLENCPLNTTTNYPFWFYDATNGEDYHQMSDFATQPVDVVDVGRLFVALSNLKAYNSSLTQRIDNIALYGRTNYTSLIPSIATDSTLNGIYDYYCVSGYASFWPQQLAAVPNAVLNNIENDQTVTAYGVSLPEASINLEPMLCAMFELNNTGTLPKLMNQVYAATQAYQKATGKFIGASEGNGFQNQFIYEWVVAPDGKPWETTSTSGQPISPTPVVFTKVSFGFLALYNSTFARDTVAYLEKTLPVPSNGYAEGADNSGHYVNVVSSNTNGLILDAALYAIAAK